MYHRYRYLYFNYKVKFKCISKERVTLANQDNF